MNNLPDQISFTVAREKFLIYLKKQKRSSATVVAYSSDLSQLAEHLGAKRITQATTVTPDHLQEFVTHISTNGYIAKSISRKINSMKTFFKFLHQEGLVPSNPTLAICHPKIENKPPRILSSTEYKALQEACRLDIRLCAAVEILLQTGMRIGELANIDLADIRKNEVLVKPYENNLERVVPLNKTAVSALNNYLAVRPQVKETKLFITKTGRPLLIRNLRAAIDRYFKSAGIKGAKVNDLRHTFVAHQMESGVDMEVLAKVLGFKRGASISKYLSFVTLPETRISKLVEL